MIVSQHSNCVESNSDPSALVNRDTQQFKNPRNHDTWVFDREPFSNTVAQQTGTEMVGLCERKHCDSQLRPTC